MKLVDLSGLRFGRLTVIERVANLYVTRTAWRCRCDCGADTVTTSESLQRGRTSSCGCFRRNDHAVITYEAAHMRLRAAKGSPSGSACIDCGQAAHQWSYDYSDPEEVTCFRRGSVYSLDPTRYVPRCPSCHKVFDLAHKTPRHVASVNVSTY